MAVLEYYDESQGKMTELPIIANIQTDVQEAPADGKQYVRQNKNWSEVNIPKGSGIEVNNTGAFPVDENTDMYVDLNNQDEYDAMIVPEAPKDGKIYGRCNGTWVEIPLK